MGALFKGPKMPKPEAPTPLPDQKEMTDSRRRRIAKEGQGAGVSSTVLAQGGREKLGA